MSKLTARKITVRRTMPGLEIRYSVEADGEAWASWLTEDDVVRFYPMESDAERQESVQRMQSFCKYKSALTAVYNGEIAGIAYLNLHPYRKIAHQCVFTIIVGQRFQGRGIGRILLEHLERLAKDGFGIELLHLEMYQGNPAIRLYRRMGYTEFGFQSHWIKEGPRLYKGKIFMEKQL